MLKSVCPKLPMIEAATTRAFYQDVLGFALLSDYGDYLILARDGVELHFFSYPTLVPAKSDFMAYIRVDAIAALHAEISAQLKDHKPNFAPTPAEVRLLETKPWGMKEFSVVDPNGTCLTFGERV